MLNASANSAVSATGKMGIELAETFAFHGAQVTLVKGPTKSSPSNSSINVIEVQTAEEMFQETTKVFPETDIAVLAAAVADYPPEKRELQKIKELS